MLSVYEYATYALGPEETRPYHYTGTYMFLYVHINKIGPFLQSLQSSSQYIHDRRDIW
jgi:hypothetical protein